MSDGSLQTTANNNPSWQQLLGWLVFAPQQWHTYYAHSTPLGQHALRRQVIRLAVLLLYGPPILYLLYFSWQPALIARSTEQSWLLPLKQNAPGSLVLMLLLLLACAAATYGTYVAWPVRRSIAWAGYLLVAAVVAFGFNPLLAAVLDHDMGMALLLGIGFGGSVSFVYALPTEALPGGTSPGLGVGMALILAGSMTRSPSLPDQPSSNYSWIYSATFVGLLVGWALLRWWRQRGLPARPAQPTSAKS